MELKRILHVEDNYDMRTITQFALEVVGQFELKQCADGHSAAGIAEHFKPDLLLLDVMMPKMSGQDVKAKINSLPGLGDIPAIYLTVKAEDKYEKRLRAEGAIGVILKPFDPMTLSERIIQIWNQRDGLVA